MGKPDMLSYLPQGGVSVDDAGSAQLPIRLRFERIAESAPDVESFASRAMKLLGDLVNARSIQLIVPDFKRDRRLIQAKLTRNGGKRRMEFDDSEFFYQKSGVKRRRTPTYLLQSLYLYALELPQRWSATLRIEFPGISILSYSDDSNLRKLLRSMSRGLHVVLMNEELHRLERRVEEEEQVNQDLREFTANLSKELHCLSSFSTVLGQIFNVAEIPFGFRRVHVFPTRWTGPGRRRNA